MTPSPRSDDIRLPYDVRIPLWEGSSIGVPMRFGVPVMAALAVWSLVDDGRPLETIVLMLAVLSVVPIALVLFARHKRLVLRSDGSAEIPTAGEETVFVRPADVVARASGPNEHFVFIGKDRQPLACLRPADYQKPQTTTRWLQQHYGRVPTIACDPRALDEYLRRHRLRTLKRPVGSPSFKKVLLALLTLLALVLFVALRNTGRL